MTIDPKKVTFSQAQGYEPLPQPLRLGELDRRARVRIWNAFYETVYLPAYEEIIEEDELSALVTDLHLEHFEGLIDEVPEGWQQPNYLEELKDGIFEERFNKVFDLLTFFMRHQACPQEFTTKMRDVFRECQLAYVVDVSAPATIYPASTPEEGSAMVDAMGVLSEHGLHGSRQHLMQSSAFINQGQWAQSVHESINAVESVARRIAPGSKTLGEALKQLRRQGLLEHPALAEGLDKLYGYTSDEQGVRHSLLDQGESKVGQDEAVFMLGACASFASYLWRKHHASG